MAPRTFFIKTFGCQMNEHDSQKIGGLLANLGFEPTTQPETADLVLFNTCTVRQKAHQKAFSEIGRAIAFKNSEPRTSNLEPRLIGVCGCVAQDQGAKLISRFQGLDLVFGPDQIYRLPELLEILQKTKKPVLATELINSAEDYHFLDDVAATKLSGPSAYVTIMKGCNSRCSYCIVPKVRGTEVYRTAREIIKEIEFLVEKGCREVTLLGQNVNSYPDFSKLIRLISENTNVERIRFTSPHTKDVKDDLIEEYATNPKLCSHIHLPVQSGSDTVLKRMRRAYNRRTYLKKVESLKKARPGLGITTDVIVGFPQESDEEFNQTLLFLKEVQFDNIFAFKYSPREATEAYSMEDDVPMTLKEERLAKVLELQNAISKKINQHYVGGTQEVLVERNDRMATRRWMGRTSCHKIVNFTGKKTSIGDIVRVEVTKANINSLEGNLYGT